MCVNEGIWIFDICGTLYKSNTTFDFLEYYFKKVDKLQLQKLKDIQNKRRLIYWFRAVLFHFFNVDLFRKKAVSLLKDHYVGQVFEEANGFLAFFLSKKQIHKTFEMLKNQSGRVILVSNSIEPVVRVIAKNLQKEFIASQLEVKNEKFTGKIINDITGKKHKELLKKDIYSYSVVTDNHSDFELVKRADKAYIIIQSKEETVFWDKLKPNYLSI